MKTENEINDLNDLNELKLFVAGLLPEKIKIIETQIATNDYAVWLPLLSDDKYPYGVRVTDHEWRSIIAMVEEGLSIEEDGDYRDELKTICFNDWHNEKTKRAFSEYATFSQRARAMMKVKKGKL